MVWSEAYASYIFIRYSDIQRPVFYTMFVLEADAKSSGDLAQYLQYTIRWASLLK